jgi:hypothetical protein
VSIFIHPSHKGGQKALTQYKTVSTCVHWEILWILSFHWYKMLIGGGKLRLSQYVELGKTLMPNIKVINLHMLEVQKVCV